MVVLQNATILLKTSTGLVMRLADDNSSMTRELSIRISACEPFETKRVPLVLFASLHPRKEKSVEHTVRS